MTQIKFIEDTREIIPVLKQYCLTNKPVSHMFQIRTEYVGVDVVVTYEFGEVTSVTRKGGSKTSYLVPWAYTLFPKIPNHMNARMRVHATIILPKENNEDGSFEIIKKLNNLLKVVEKDPRVTYRAYSFEVFNPNSLKYEYLSTEERNNFLNCYFKASRIQYVRQEWLSSKNNTFVSHFSVAEEDLTIPIKGYSIETLEYDVISTGSYPEILYYSTLKAVDDLQGSTGVFMPIGIISPVVIGCSVITRIHLESYRRIDELDLHINDYVAIHVSPLGLPLIHNVVLDKREIDGSNIVPIYPPEKCPICHEFLVPHSVYHRCLNGYHGPTKISKEYSL